MLKNLFIGILLVITSSFCYGMDSFAPIINKTKDAIVSIQVTAEQSASNPLEDMSPFFRDFFGGDSPFGFESGTQEVQAVGSGFIISSDGYIVTNNHVVDGAKNITIKTIDGQEYKGKIAGTDPLTDLALIKISTKVQLPKITLGDSDNLNIGDWVIAIGNPLGLGWTVTAGIVSARGRDISLENYEDFIQTDAAINHGNSGGPLINTNGEVIGINTAILSGGQNMGFAIPVNMLKDIMEQLKKGSVNHGWIGIRMQELSDDLSKSFNLENKNGVLVSDIESDSPAEKGGMKAGDIIVNIDNKPVLSTKDLRLKVGGFAPNEKHSFTVIRNKKRMDLSIKIGSKSSDSGDMVEKKDKSTPDGEEISVADIPKSDLSQLGLRSGVSVVSISKNTGIARSGIALKDIIIGINDVDNVNTKSFYDEYHKVKKGEIIRIRVVRGNSKMFLAFTK